MRIKGRHSSPRLRYWVRDECEPLRLGEGVVGQGAGKLDGRVLPFHWTGSED
jgi:hypothetical protein